MRARVNREINVLNLLMACDRLCICLCSCVFSHVFLSDRLKEFTNVIACLLLIVSLLLCFSEALSQGSKSDHRISERVPRSGKWLNQVYLILQNVLHFKLFILSIFKLSFQLVDLSGKVSYCMVFLWELLLKVNLHLVEFLIVLFSPVSNLCFSDISSSLNDGIKGSQTSFPESFDEHASCKVAFLHDSMASVLSDDSWEVVQDLNFSICIS